MKFKSIRFWKAFLLVAVISFAMSCNNDDPKPVCGDYDKTTADIKKKYDEAFDKIAEDECDDLQKNLDDIITLYDNIKECSKLVQQIKVDGYNSYEDFRGYLKYDYHQELAGYCGSCAGFSNVEKEIVYQHGLYDDAVKDEDCDEAEKRLKIMLDRIDSIQFCEEFIELLEINGYTFDAYREFFVDSLEECK
jgi:hypothetical protein